MRYLSPTSISLFQDNREDFYLNYVCPNKLPKMPQTVHMAVGSSFDAHAKSYIVENLYGHDVVPGFKFEEIFEKQVEPQNRDVALGQGQTVFKWYTKLGALKELMMELEQAAETPRFETEVQGTIDGVPLLGKPDIYFRTREGGYVIFDWKVNGFLAKNPVSPKTHYVVCRNPDGTTKQYKHSICITKFGIKMNCMANIDSIDSDWGQQLSIYAWLLGQGVGQQFIVGIDQCLNNPVSVVSYRGFVGKDFQFALWNRIKDAWASIEKGHIFTELSLEDSKAKCALLDERYKNFVTDDPKQNWFNQVTRK